MKLKEALLISGIIIVVASSIFVFVYRPPDKLEVDFLDVGQGDAELIKTPYGQNILIDGGPDSRVIDRLGENLPIWDKRIDLMILTHPHDDHVNGLNEVIKRYDVKKIIYTGAVHNSPGYLNWLNLVKNKKIPLAIVDRPQTIVLSDDLQFKILYPLRSFLGREVDNLNNTSIVVKLIYRKNSFLFMGDAETAEENEIINAAGKNKEEVLRAQVLKVGHHGSNTATSQEFLSAVSPNLAVIEAGRDNKFRHPNLRTLNKLERLGVKVYRTDKDGTVVMTSDGNIIQVGK